MEDQNTGTKSLHESGAKLQALINDKLCEAVQADLSPQDVADLELKLSTIKKLGTFE